jgi:preprotein translocase subunit SecE
VARDRKRAKQRRQRAGGDARTAKAGAIAPSQPVRPDLPAALDHASGEVDEFDAALVRGAQGTPVSPDELTEKEIEAEAVAEGDLSEDALQEPAAGGSGGGSRGGGAVAVGSGGGGGGGGGVSPEQASGAPLRGGNRAIGFLRASWAELQRVQWPDRRQVTQATAVVLGFVAIAGAYLGLADFVAKEFVEFIL